ncbi:hypothetical protein KEG38_10910 [Polyangium jinanense]|uniref:Uncharacterized protein n=2 Tax=Polyangium jinanense TaxID=2829994 RepID=A0A9X4AVD0_9BACT|nr:hypothetical protein [Polyangium jinanense]MDC3954361.1 hypothetical protein [Polyangium jinanense]MDC3984187.1 hypothetical protein [Polyangium jinanense]
MTEAVSITNAAGSRATKVPSMSAARLRTTGKTMKELSHPDRAEELLLRAFAEVDMSNEDPGYTKDPEEDEADSCYDEDGE